jgi:FlaA1/EpsC-like NDP-sugar epimerase
VPRLGEAGIAFAADLRWRMPTRSQVLNWSRWTKWLLVTVRDFRELDVEDLLGRTPVPPDTQLLARNLTGQVVMVTGAGGSIGSELCRQIVLQRPRQLLLVDHNEFGLYTIHQELQALCAARELSAQEPVELVPLLGSVVSYARMSALCKLYQPAIVYHATAYKHVPMVEGNAGEGIANNVFGTLNMARAALENSVRRFVLISTDKAVRPTNVMGASKRMAELVLQALAAAQVGQPGPHPSACFMHGQDWQCSGLQRQCGALVPAPACRGRALDGDSF